MSGINWIFVHYKCSLIFSNALSICVYYVLFYPEQLFRYLQTVISTADLLWSNFFWLKIPKLYLTICNWGVDIQQWHVCWILELFYNRRTTEIIQCVMLQLFRKYGSWCLTLKVCSVFIFHLPFITFYFLFCINHPHVLNKLYIL